MNAFRTTLALSTLAAVFSGGVAFAQHDDHGGPPQQRQGGGPDWNHHDNHQYVHHDDWQKGRRLPPDYWQHGERVDYRQHRLPPPRRGYEWREVDGNYVMAAVATGLIASVIASAGR
jgi:Ni/Co efflux regulator RcnB